MQEQYNTLVEIGQGEDLYDHRRHLKMIFLACANYQLFVAPAAANNLRHYLFNESAEVSASYICNNKSRWFGAGIVQNIGCLLTGWLVKTNI